MKYQYRPLGPWTGPVTEDRRSARFRAGWDSTLDLLEREVWQLGADQVVIQLDVTEPELRRDGMPRANALPNFPGVRISFDSMHGPLTYSTDEYPYWRDNVRAIALSLEALRAVDRYGVSRQGEQYRGWTAIAAYPAGSAAPPEAVMSVADAARLLAQHGDVADWRALAGDRDGIGRAFRAAARATSPDRGGDPRENARVLAARERLYRALADGEVPG